MRICTLIVRLLGFYLVTMGSVTLYQMQRAKSMMGGLNNPFTSDVAGFAIVQFLVGLAAVLFAAKLARLLTFDAGRDDF